MIEEMRIANCELRIAPGAMYFELLTDRQFDFFLSGKPCSYDPSVVQGPIGMFHCPECGEMVLAGVAHPDYSLVDDYDPDKVRTPVPPDAAVDSDPGEAQRDDREGEDKAASRSTSPPHSKLDPRRQAPDSERVTEKLTRGNRPI